MDTARSARAKTEPPQSAKSTKSQARDVIATVSTPTKRYKITNPPGAMPEAPGTPFGASARGFHGSGSRFIEPSTPSTPKKSSAMKKGILSSSKEDVDSPKKPVSYYLPDPFSSNRHATPQRYMGLTPKIEPHSLMTDAAKTVPSLLETPSSGKGNKEKRKNEKRDKKMRDKVRGSYH